MHLKENINAALQATDGEVETSFAKAVKQIWGIERTSLIEQSTRNGKVYYTRDSQQRVAEYIHQPGKVHRQRDKTNGSTVRHQSAPYDQITVFDPKGNAAATIVIGMLDKHAVEKQVSASAYYMEQIDDIMQGRAVPYVTSITYNYPPEVKIVRHRTSVDTNSIKNHQRRVSIERREGRHLKSWLKSRELPALPNAPSATITTESAANTV